MCIHEQGNNNLLEYLNNQLVFQQESRDQEYNPCYNRKLDMEDYVHNHFQEHKNILLVL
jgi:hypothetical protein